VDIAFLRVASEKGKNEEEEEEGKTSPKAPVPTPHKAPIKQQHLEYPSIGRSRYIDRYIYPSSGGTKVTCSGQWISGMYILLHVSVGGHDITRRKKEEEEEKKARIQDIAETISIS